MKQIIDIVAQAESKNWTILDISMIERLNNNEKTIFALGVNSNQLDQEVTHFENANNKLILYPIKKVAITADDLLDFVANYNLTHNIFTSYRRNPMIQDFCQSFAENYDFKKLLATRTKEILDELKKQELNLDSQKVYHIEKNLPVLNTSKFNNFISNVLQKKEPTASNVKDMEVKNINSWLSHWQDIIKVLDETQNMQQKSHMYLQYRYQKVEQPKEQKNINDKNFYRIKS